VTPSRLNAVLDGVFAIAMTLLVLDLPHPSASRTLAHDLEVHWDAYIAYLVSFATLGVVWLEHHGLMLAVQRTTRAFIEITFAFLLFVALLPWPTSLTAAFADEARSAPVVTVLYSSTMFLIAVTLAALFGYASRHGAIVVEGMTEALRRSSRRTALGCLPYLLAIGVAFVSPLTSLILDGAVVVYLAFTRSALERAEAGLTTKRVSNGVLELAAAPVGDEHGGG